MIVNQRSMGKFRASRGFSRQDPLSPFLIRLCLEVLGVRWRKLEQLGVWGEGFRTRRDGVDVSHLQCLMILFLHQQDGGRLKI